MAAPSGIFAVQQNNVGIPPVTASGRPHCLPLKLLLPYKGCLPWPHSQPTVRGLCGRSSPAGGSAHLSPTQTVATLSVLGTRRVVSILGVENQAVSLAACHLLQVMFEALKEGVKKGFRGKEGAIIVGERKQDCGPLGVAVMEGKGLSQPGLSGSGLPVQVFQEYGLVTVFYSLSSQGSVKAGAQPRAQHPGRPPCASLVSWGSSKVTCLGHCGTH